MNNIKVVNASGEIIAEYNELSLNINKASDTYKFKGLNLFTFKLTGVIKPWGLFDNSPYKITAEDNLLFEIYTLRFIKATADLSFEVYAGVTEGLALLYVEGECFYAS